MLNFIEDRRKKKDPNKWWQVFLWYCYHIFMIILVAINICFLIVNWKFIEIKIDNVQIFLTFIGFLFAFAGINIYSIFNTIIDEQKERLNDLGDKYIKEIDDKIQKMFEYHEYHKKIIYLLQLGQCATSTLKFNSQMFDWFENMKKSIKDCSNYFVGKEHPEDDEDYKRTRGVFIDLTRGLWYMIEQFKERITNEKSNYFQEAEAQYAKMEFLNVVDDMIKALYQLQNGKFPDETSNNPVQKEITWKDWISIKFPIFGNLIKTFA